MSKKETRFSLFLCLVFLLWFNTASAQGVWGTGGAPNQATQQNTDTQLKLQDNQVQPKDFITAVTEMNATVMNSLVNQFNTEQIADDKRIASSAGKGSTPEAGGDLGNSSAPSAAAPAPSAAPQPSAAPAPTPSAQPPAPPPTSTTIDGGNNQDSGGWNIQY